MAKNEITNTTPILDIEDKSLAVSSPEGQAMAIAPATDVQNITDAESRFLAELDAEIGQELQALSIGEFTNPSDVLGIDLTLVDCIPFSLTDKETQLPKQLVMYVCQTPADISVGEGEKQRTYLKDALLYIPQSSNSIRDRFVSIYNNVRQHKSVTKSEKMFALTHVHFEELQRGGKAGNKPIALQFTPETQKLWI